LNIIAVEKTRGEAVREYINNYTNLMKEVNKQGPKSIVLGDATNYLSKAIYIANVLPNDLPYRYKMEITFQYVLHLHKYGFSYQDIIDYSDKFIKESLITQSSFIPLSPYNIAAIICYIISSKYTDRGKSLLNLYYAKTIIEMMRKTESSSDKQNSIESFCGIKIGWDTIDSLDKEIDNKLTTFFPDDYVDATKLGMAEIFKVNKKYNIIYNTYLYNAWYKLVIDADQFEERDKSEIQNLIGEFYEWILEPKDMRNAILSYQEAIRLGSTMAKTNYARLIISGKIKEEAPQKAYTLINEIELDASDGVSDYLMGVLFENGFDSIKIDYKKAIIYYLNAYERSNMPSLFAYEDEKLKEIKNESINGISRLSNILVKTQLSREINLLDINVITEEHICYLALKLLQIGERENADRLFNMARDRRYNVDSFISHAKREKRFPNENK
jgi:TPR repeat protein